MHIAQVIDALQWGGAEKWIFSFSEVAKLRGLVVTVISLQPFIDDNPYRVQLESLGVKVFPLSISTLYDFAAMPPLLRIFQTERFDLVQTHLTHANILGTLVGRSVDIPTVATLHSTHLGTEGHYHTRSVFEQIVLRYSPCKIIAVGNGVAEAHRLRLGRKEIDVIPNAVKLGVVLSDSARETLRAELVGDFETYCHYSGGQTDRAKRIFPLAHGVCSS